MQTLRSVCSLLIFLDFCCSLVAYEFTTLSIKVLLTEVTNRSQTLDYRSKVGELHCSGFIGLVGSGFSTLGLDLSKS